MSTPTATSVAVPVPARRTGAGRGLLWVIWRQHRAGVAAAALVLGAFAALLVVNGSAMHADVRRVGLPTCGNPNGPSCRLPVELFLGRYSGIAMFLPRILEFLPGVLGVFLGAPLVAREFEAGTFRFAWTQGHTRTRLLTAKLCTVAGVLVVLTVAFAQLFAWWFGPFVPIMGRMEGGQAYEVEGVVFAARTLFALLLGALLGALIRRTVPAMAATAVGWLAVAWPSAVYLRPLIAAPVTVRADSPGLDVSTTWVIDDWYQNASGHRLSGRAAEQLVLQANPNTRVDVNQWLAGRGYTEWVSYQPGSRFWYFQAIEASCYLLLALACGAAAVWWVRRRAA